MNPNNNELSRTLKHEGVRIGEIIAYRAWAVINPGWFRSGDDRLRSVFMRDYVWHPDEPASGDVRTHGIYSFRDVIHSRAEYGYPGSVGPLLLGKVKIWGEIVEHEAGYRSEFGRLVSLDYGDRSFWISFGKSTGLIRCSRKPILLKMEIAQVGDTHSRKPKWAT
jgi:hypothetical protein